MRPLLYLDINLSTVTDDVFVGRWTVVARALARADATTPLARAPGLTLQPGYGLLVHPDDASAALAGTWTVERDALLKRPYLLLQVPSPDAGAPTEPTRALVTRLRRTAADGPRALTLYFQSGMELQLAAEPSAS